MPSIRHWIKCGMRKFDELHCRAKKYQNVVHWIDFLQCTNKVAKNVQKAHYDYTNQTIGDRLIKQPKSFWSYVNMNVVDKGQSTF